MSGEINGIISLLFSVLQYLILARVILSWVPVQPGDVLFDLVVIVDQITDPLCLPFQKLIPPIGGIDFSVIFVFFFLQIFEAQIFSMLAR